MKNWFFGKKKRVTDVWPKTEDGQNVPPVFLTHTSEEDMQTELTINLLEAYGIPVVTQYPNDGSFGKVVLGMAAAGVDLFVPQTLYEEANDLLHSEPVEEEEN